MSLKFATWTDREDVKSSTSQIGEFLCRTNISFRTRHFSDLYGDKDLSNFLYIRATYRKIHRSLLQQL